MIESSKNFSLLSIGLQLTHCSNCRFFPIQQTIEVSSSPVSGIIFSQLRATVTGTVNCLPDSGAHCNDISVSLHSLDSSGKHDGKQSAALLKSKI